MADLVRWGIVGTGAISAAFVSDLALSGNSVVTAVYSRDSDRARRFVDEHGLAAIARGGARAEFLRDDDTDVLYVATPQGTHHRIARAALRAGRHVVVEKPMARDAHDVRDLAREARDAGRFLMEAMWTKFSPAFRDVVAIVDSGRIGVIRSVQASFGAPFLRGTGSRWSADLGGSALLDQGIYTVTLARELLGAPQRLTASGSFFAPGVDETEWMTFEYANGAFAQLASSMVQWIDPSASISGTEGYLRVDAPFWAASRLEIHSGSPTETIFDAETRNYEVEGHGYVPMIRSASDAILSGALEHPVHSIGDTLATFEILDEIREVLSARA